MYNDSYVSMGSSHFLYNTACDGGAIYDNGASRGYLALQNSSISQNIARIQGGGIYLNYTGTLARLGIDGTGITGNTASDAGGLFDSNNPSGFLESSSSVVLGNTATMTGGCRNIGDVPCT